MIYHHVNMWVGEMYCGMQIQDIPDMAVDDVGEELGEGGVIGIVQLFIKAVDGTLGMSVPGLLWWSQFRSVGLHSS